MIESWYTATANSSIRNGNETVLHQMLMEHFQPLLFMLGENKIEREAVQRLGSELAQYCQGDPDVLGEAQRYLFRYLNDEKKIAPDRLVPIISEIAAGFTHQSQDLIFERYQLLIDNYHKSQQQLLREKTQLALINHIGSQIAAVLDLDELFVRMAELVQSAFGYQHVAIFMLEDEEAVLRAAAGEYAHRFPPEYSQSINDGIVGWVARNGRDYLTNDTHESAEFQSLESKIPQTRSELCVPIKAADRTIGVFDVQCPEIDVFDPENVTALHTLVVQLAVAIEKARLHNQVQQELAERFQVEQALRQSERQYRHIVESQTEMICRFQADGLLTFVNRTYAYYFYQEPKDLIGRFIYQFSHEKDVELLRAKIESLAPMTPIVTYEHRVYLPDGSIGWHRWTAQGFFNHDHELIEIQGVGRDITESKKLEEAMHRAQKLESLGVLAGGVAHDFNNLLAAITNESALAGLKQGSNNSAAVKQHLDNIAIITERATHFTRQLLTYAGEGHAQLESVNLNNVIRDVLVIASASVPKLVSLQTDLEKGLPQVDGDLGQLQQVVMNLIINAAEAYEGEKGVVFIKTSTQVNEMGQQEVMLNIIDRGCGMDRETLNRVFDPFFTTKLTGRGLGLAAVQGIVHTHQGHIMVTSNFGQGTEFSVAFPFGTLELEGEKDSAPAISAPEKSSKKTILIVEDDETIRRSTSEMLTLKGFDIYTAENGFEGIKTYREHHEVIDLVILDMTMPVMSGDEALAEIRQLKADIPVVVLSGYGRKEVMRSIEGLDHLVFLQKPYRLMDLLTQIESML